MTKGKRSLCPNIGWILHHNAFICTLLDLSTKQSQYSNRAVLQLPDKNYDGVFNGILSDWSSFSLHECVD